MGFVIHWHESAMDLHVFPIPISPPTSLSTQSVWVFPVHQARALVSCIQPGLVICFTLDNIHVLMLFSRNIPPSPSPTESKSLFCTSVSLLLFCIYIYIYIFYIYIYIYKMITLKCYFYLYTQPTDGAERSPDWDGQELHGPNKKTERPWGSLRPLTSLFLFSLICPMIARQLDTKTWC